MGILWGVGFIAALAFIIYIIDKVGREKIRVIIYALTIPLWIYLIFYYADIRATILFLGMIAFEVLMIYLYIKE